MSKESVRVLQFGVTHGMIHTVAMIRVTWNSGYEAGPLGRLGTACASTFYSKLVICSFGEFVL